MNPAPTKVFLDCEFTDFVDFKMISIGLVADSAEEFYAELNVDAKECSEFVQLAVIPLLGRSPGSVCEDIDEVGDRLRTWLEEFDERKLINNEQEVFLCSNSGILPRLGRRVGFGAYGLCHRKLRAVHVRNWWWQP